VRRRFESCRGQLPDGFKNTQIAKVTPKLVDDLYAHLSRVGKRKPATVIGYHAVLRAAFAQAERWSWVDAGEAVTVVAAASVTGTPRRP